VSRGCFIRGSKLTLSHGISIESAGIVPWLVFSIDGESVDLRTASTTSLEISVPGAIRRLIVNGTSFDLNEPSNRVTLIQTDAGWKRQCAVREAKLRTRD